MLVRTVKMTSKGQITIPADAVRAIRARKGTEFVLVQEGEEIILRKAESVGREIVDDTRDFGMLALPVFQRLWDNEEDEVWNQYG